MDSTVIVEDPVTADLARRMPLSMLKLKPAASEVRRVTSYSTQQKLSEKPTANYRTTLTTRSWTGVLRELRRLLKSNPSRKVRVLVQDFLETTTYTTKEKLVRTSYMYDKCGRLSKAIDRELWDISNN